MARKHGKNRGIFFRANARGTVLGPDGARGEFWIRFTDGAGLLHREKAGTMTAARALVERRRTEKRQGLAFPENLRRSRGVTLREVCESYLLHAKANGVRTVVRIESRLREALSLLGPMAAASLTPADLERLKLQLVEGPKTKSRKPASVNRYLTDLKAALLLAVRAGVLDKSPFTTVSLLREANERTRELTRAEEERIMFALLPDPPALRPAIRFAFATGARASELVRLRWADVSEHDGVARLAETKAGVAQNLMLSSAALSILAALPRYGPHVFGWEDGSPFTRDYISHRFTAAARKAGVADTRLHDARHAYASRLRRAGADLLVLSQLLRHSTPRMAQRYAHISRQDLRRALEAAVDSGTELAPVLTLAPKRVRQGKGKQ